LIEICDNLLALVTLTARRGAIVVLRIATEFASDSGCCGKVKNVFPMSRIEPQFSDFTAYSLQMIQPVSYRWYRQQPTDDTDSGSSFPD